jgi:hypothetical protein
MSCSKEVKGAGEDVQHGQLGAEERAAGRGHAVAPGDEWQQIEAGLANLDHAIAAGEGVSASGHHWEQEAGSSKEHDEELRLVAQDLDDGLVLETWHEIRMPPPSDIPAPLPRDYRTAFLAVANYVDSQLAEWHVIANGN